MSSFNIKNDVTWRDFLIRSAFIIGTVVIIVWMMPRSSNISFKIERGKPSRITCIMTKSSTSRSASSSRTTIMVSPDFPRIISVSWPIAFAVCMPKVS